MNESIPIRPTDLAPVQDWLGDLRLRIEGWSKQLKLHSSAEWAHLQTTLTKTLSTQRVEQVLRDFLARVGVGPRETDHAIDEALNDLRRRIVAYRRLDSIESYERFLSPPPNMKF
ncbi:MAG: hypothetical protein AB7O52_00265 [Planctomycetota bacterium]